MYVCMRYIYIYTYHIIYIYIYIYIYMHAYVYTYVFNKRISRAGPGPRFRGPCVHRCTDGEACHKPQGLLVSLVKPSGISGIHI